MLLHFAAMLVHLYSTLISTLISVQIALLMPLVRFVIDVNRFYIAFFSYLWAHPTAAGALLLLSLVLMGIQDWRQRNATRLQFVATGRDIALQRVQAPPPSRASHAEAPLAASSNRTGGAASPGHLQALDMLEDIVCTLILPPLPDADRRAAMGVCRAWRARILRSAELRPTVQLGTYVCRDEPSLSTVAYTAACGRCPGQQPPVGPPVVAGSATVFAFFEIDSFGCSTPDRERYGEWLLAHLPAGLHSLELDFGLDAGLLRQLGRFTHLLELTLGGSACAFDAGHDAAMEQVYHTRRLLPPPAPCSVSILAESVPRSVRTLR
ncbi:hypothetical protein ABPG75_012188 [Micractinium tetrahymenae]